MLTICCFTHRFFIRFAKFAVLFHLTAALQNTIQCSRGAFEPFKVLKAAMSSLQVLIFLKKQASFFGHSNSSNFAVRIAVMRCDDSIKQYTVHFSGVVFNDSEVSYSAIGNGVQAVGFTLQNILGLAFYGLFFNIQ